MFKGQSKVIDGSGLVKDAYDIFFSHNIVDLAPKQRQISKQCLFLKTMVHLLRTLPMWLLM